MSKLSWVPIVGQSFTLEILASPCRLAGYLRLKVSYLVARVVQTTEIEISLAFLAL